MTLGKLQQQVPNLMQDTWLLNIAQMPTEQAFGTAQSRTVQCINTTAFINPDYKLERLHDAFLSRDSAIGSREFASWYGRFRESRSLVEKRGNPWLVRGLHVVIVQPE